MDNKNLTHERLVNRLNQVDDVLIVNWVHLPEDGDYRKALAELITQNIAEHDDPRISAPAALIKRLKDAAVKLIADCEKCGGTGIYGTFCTISCPVCGEFRRLRAEWEKNETRPES